LIIRTWIEQGSLRPLRVRIRLTTDVSSGFERELTLTDVGAVSAAVETWLRDVLEASEPFSGGSAVSPGNVPGLTVPAVEPKARANTVLGTDPDLGGQS
jgi:hypothetical protein